ncbi:MAG: FG-GAP-like repeat-containing protein [Acidobacteriia bacterium]|nr:FG-GAP-like repeat-containing protein [Terriglobia bacterium]
MKPLFYVCLFVICLSSTVVLGQTNPVPLINQPLVPTSTPPGGSGFTLTVNGTGFVSGAVVKWNGTPLTTTFVGNSQLTAAVPSTNIATAGTASVTVLNRGTGSASNVAYFPISNPTVSVSLNSSQISTASLITLATGDFNADGKLDLVLGNNGSSISILLGNGDGTFQPSVSYGTGGSTGAVVIGDFNDDGKLDIADASCCLGLVSVFLGNGDGTFQNHIDSNTATGSAAVVAADLDGDGKLDLALADNNSPGGLFILRGLGDGTFRAFGHFLLHSGQSFGLAAGDFNRDGKIDLALTNGGANTADIFLNKGNGKFQPPVSFATRLGPSSIAVADLNGDGKLDLMVAGSAISVLLGNGDGTFQSAVNYSTGIGPKSVIAGDFNADGKLDAALINAFSFDLSIYLGNGDGTLKPRLRFASGPNPQFLVTGDFNGDGKLDLASNVQSAVSIFLQTQ